MSYRLKPEELRALCDPAMLPFVSTSELPALDGVSGQERAVGATASFHGTGRPESRRCS